jgi:hypothetical protein
MTPRCVGEPPAPSTENNGVPRRPQQRRQPRRPSGLQSHRLSAPLKLCHSLATANRALTRFDHGGRPVGTKPRQGLFCRLTAEAMGLVFGLDRQAPYYVIQPARHDPVGRTDEVHDRRHERASDEQGIHKDGEGQAAELLEDPAITRTLVWSRRWVAGSTRQSPLGQLVSMVWGAAIPIGGAAAGSCAVWVSAPQVFGGQGHADRD